MEGDRAAEDMGAHQHELKRFAATTQSLIDQLTRYMGWAAKHVAKHSQKVRGIIIVGKPDERLVYSVGAIPNVEIKCFRLGLENYRE